MRILVAGIGNVFQGDDGFGIEVVRRLSEQPLGDDVEVADFGIRGVHLAYELTGGMYDAAILIDAVPQGGQPGTLYAIEPDVGAAETGETSIDAHSLTPAAVLGLVRHIGGQMPKVVVIGCEPAMLADSMELSSPVAAAVDAAVRMTCDYIVRMRGAVPCA
jgi:hydrogenase maturation protease